MEVLGKIKDFEKGKMVNLEPSDGKLFKIWLKNYHSKLPLQVPRSERGMKKYDKKLGVLMEDFAINFILNLEHLELF